MRGISVNPQRMRALRRVIVAGSAFVAMLTLTGCSTGNITGFDFPSFGLTDKADDRDAYGSGRPAEQRLGNQ